MDDLLDELYYMGPKQFTAARIAAEKDLFAVRAALVYTPISLAEFRLTQEHVDSPAKAGTRVIVEAMAGG